MDFHLSSIWDLKRTWKAWNAMLFAACRITAAAGGKRTREYFLRFLNAKAFGNGNRRTGPEALRRLSSF